MSTDFTTITDVKINPSLPFYPTSAGKHEFRKGESESPTRTANNFVQLIWCVSGIGEVVLYGKTFILQSGDFFWYLPGEDHFYRAISSCWKNRWLCIMGERAADFLLSYAYPRHIVSAGKCPVQLFDEIEQNINSKDMYARRMQISRTAELLALAGRSEKREIITDSPIENTVRIIHDSFQDPSLDVNLLCEKLGMHRSTLTRLFQRKMKRTPGEYLLSIRAHHGLSLLSGTELPVGEIAKRSGIPDPCRFSRVIRRVTGKSPQEYRKAYMKKRS